MFLYNSSLSMYKVQRTYCYSTLFVDINVNTPVTEIYVHRNWYQPQIWNTKRTPFSPSSEGSRIHATQF